MDKIKADPLAINAVICAVLRGTSTLPEDFPRATMVDTFSMIYHKFPDWVEVTPGDFSILGMLENMHTLHFPNRPSKPIPVDDFSFLARCRKLKRLDVSCTSFSDCSILLQLPPLNYVRLPAKSQLTHLEALEQLPKTTKVSFLNPPVPAAPPVSAPPPQKEPEGSDKAKAIVEEFKRRTAAVCYKLTIQPGVIPGLADSKFGGFPYWDPSLPYPVNKAGEKLVLLAQINFDQLPAGDPLPQGGLLQFFIGQDDVCGADFDEPDCQDCFRVVYHERVDPSITEAQLKPLEIPTHEGQEYFPVFQQAAVAMEKTTDFMGLDDCHLETVFAQVVKSVTGEDTGGLSPYKYFSKDDYNYFHNQLYSCGHRMLGYPFFTQYDPRPEDSPYDTLLFQMDSDGSRGGRLCAVGRLRRGQLLHQPEGLEAAGLFQGLLHLGLLLISTFFNEVSVNETHPQRLHYPFGGTGPAGRAHPRYAGPLRPCGAGVLRLPGGGPRHAVYPQGRPF